ncbi:hypothetical protein Tcan_03621 [Toxocara canis]|uniref:Uncharacterized protein n=1 Tax=Toxocara canis TaxID=6265 RepID=A0A0B2UWT4_TOXCA|nr:hypothetical protein Tcan_03621 [Toxocara canis]
MTLIDDERFTLVNHSPPISFAVFEKRPFVSSTAVVVFFLISGTFCKDFGNITTSLLSRQHDEFKLRFCASLEVTDPCAVMCPTNRYRKCEKKVDDLLKQWALQCDPR